MPGPDQPQARQAWIAADLQRQLDRNAATKKRRKGQPR